MLWGELRANLTPGVEQQGSGTQCDGIRVTILDECKPNYSLLDSIQRKALRIIGTSEEEARSQLNISSLHHRRQVAAATVLYKMHISLCSRNLKALLPEPFVVRRATRSSLSLPSYACWQCPFPEQYLLTEPLSTLQSQSGTACLMTWLATFLTTVNRPSSVECMSI